MIKNTGRFRVGREYSRREINTAVGGSVVSYLPHLNGVITCGCFRLDLNPGAPTAVTINRPERPEPKMLLKQAEPIPVFLKRSGGKWEYQGRFKFKGLSQNHAVLQDANAANPKRSKGKVRAVLYFKRVAD